MNKEEIVLKKIHIELDKIKPKLILDGGNIEFINFKNGVLKVKLTGECANCPVSNITMKYIIEDTLKNKIPEIKKVIQVKLNII